MPGTRKAQARRWFQQASYDLKAGRWNSQGGFHATACFLAQQAGEKALKSLWRTVARPADQEGRRREAGVAVYGSGVTRTGRQSLQWTWVSGLRA